MVVMQQLKGVQRRTGCRSRAFTLVEILIVVLIAAIAGTIALTAYSSTDAGFRPERAARELTTALRYARSLAMSTNTTCGVEIDTSLKQFRVYQVVGASYNTVPQSLMGSGTYVVSMVTQKEIAGVTMTPAIVGSVTNPYQISFNSLGATANSGTVSITYAGRARVLSIPSVGDPQ